jgi:hypothetical protein
MHEPYIICDVWNILYPMQPFLGALHDFH